MGANFTIELRQVGVRLASGQPLFEAITHTFSHGLTGLVGPNGSGKSALAGILAGRLTPTSGTRLCHGRVHWVPQAICPGPGDTVADIAGMGRLLAAWRRLQAGSGDAADCALLDGYWELPAMLARALQAAGLSCSPDAPATGLSGGALTRAALAGAFMAPADILLLDEPSNHLDTDGRNWLAERLRTWPGSAVVVSHDRRLLAQMDAIVELDAHGLHAYGGSYQHYLQQRQGEALAAQAALDHARKERAAEQRAQRLQHDRQHARAARNARQARSANIPAIARGKRKADAQAHAGRQQQGREAALNAAEAAVREAAAKVLREPQAALVLPESAVPQGRRVLMFDGAVPPWPRGAAALDLALSGPVRLALTGPNGCGKSTLLRMLAGSLSAAAGHCAAGVPAAWLDQHANALLRDGDTVLSALERLDCRLPQGELRSRLAMLGLGARQCATTARELSGGERLKAALACALWQGRPAQLLILDEPSNHLDLPSVLALEAALRDYPGALVVASHDANFLQALAPTHELAWRNTGWQLTLRSSSEA